MKISYIGFWSNTSKWHITIKVFIWWLPIWKRNLSIYIYIYICVWQSVSNYIFWQRKTVRTTKHLFKIASCVKFKVSTINFFYWNLNVIKRCTTRLFYSHFVYWGFPFRQLISHFDNERNVICVWYFLYFYLIIDLSNNAMSSLTDDFHKQWPPKSLMEFTRQWLRCYYWYMLS